VQTGKTVASNNNAITITAYDVDLDGSVNSGTAALLVHGASSGQTLGIISSTPTVQLEIATAELQRISSASMTIGSSLSGSIHVSGVADTDSDAIGTLTFGY
jgi:hypothetical protein